MRDLTKKEKWFIIRERIAATTLLICIIAYVLTGYYTAEWRWPLLIFLAVPLMPVLLGLEKLYISFDLIVVIAYLVIGFTTKQWHPWWVLFLLIPVYHILFHNFKWDKYKANAKDFFKDDKEERIDNKAKKDKKDFMDAEIDEKYTFKE
jgi:hypothetical protein